MAINFDEAFTKNYMETMYPQEPEQPEPEVQLASANTGVMTDGGIAPIPRNKAQEALGFVGQMLTKAGVQLDKIGLDVPVLGKITLNDLLIGESGRILEDMSYGFMPTGKSRMEDRGVVVGPSGERRVSGLSGSAPMLDPSVIDVAGLPFVGVGAKAALKGTKKIIEAGKDLPVGMSIKMVDGTDAVVPKAPAIDTPAFVNWFSDSKVVDEAGAPIAVYHGTGRPDRVGEQFRKSRATSGPMSFFTDNPEVASGYAKGKTDTSITYEDDAFDYKNWFKKKVGRENLNLEQVGARMSSQEKQDVLEKLRNIGTDDNGNIITGQGIVSDSTFDFMLKDSREANGNPLKLANKLWLESGALYGKEDEFAKVLQLAGVKGFEYNDPHAKFPFVYKVFLSIKNPLDTANIGEDVISSLEEASKRVRKKPQTGGADQWDKNTIAPKDWIARLKSDQAEGTTHAWTSIPDWVTKTLKAKGFDGIKDSGGKGGGTAHNVWIPFEENQVKSALGNQGTFSESKNIMRGVGVGGTGAAMSQEENK